MNIICIKLFLVFLVENRGSSKYCGVCREKKRNKWNAQIQHNHQTHYIGSFEIEEDAAKAVNLKCQELNITLKNPGVGVLNHETLKKLKTKVSNFLFNFFNWFYFRRKRAMGKQCVFK